MTSSRIIFIGLDAMEASLLLGWGDASYLPAIQYLRRAGATANTIPLVGLGNDATWGSVNTGLAPGRVGRYFVRQVRPGTYRAVKLRDRDIIGTPFWNTVSRAGKRVAVVDMPYAPIVPDVNGIQLADWLVHGPLYDHKLQTAPASLAREIFKRYGKDPVGRSDRPGRRSLSQLIELRDGLQRKVEMKSNLVCDLLSEERWDLFCVTFTAAHCAGHQLWHIHDPQHPEYDSSIARSIGDPMKDVYMAIDSAIGRILEHVTEDTTIILFTGPGMGPHYSPSYLLDDILRRLEDGPSAPAVTFMTRVKAMYRSGVPSGVRKGLRSLADSVDEASISGDRSRRKCFSVPSNEIAGAIRVNLVGREPQGRVQRGAEFDRLFDSLANDLMELVNIDTGNPIVRDVVRSDRLYQGEHLDELPDILVLWNGAEPIGGVKSPKIGEIRRPYPGNRTGDHIEDSILIAKGPGIPPGNLLNPISPMDIAPTVAALLGVNMRDIDGKPIHDFNELPGESVQT